MDTLLSFILPYLKAYVAAALGWLIANQSQASAWIVDAVNQAFGLVLPDAAAAAIVGLVVAVAVWAVPNKKI